MTADNEFGPASDYLPHRPPMVLIDDVVEITDIQGTCRTVIKPDCVFALDGLVHPTAMIEFVAQVCAISVGATAARSGDPPRLGLIMGCREITFDVDTYAVGDVLTIVVTKIFGQSQVAAFTGTVHRDGKLCTTVQLSVVDAELAAASLPQEDA